MEDRDAPPGEPLPHRAKRLIFGLVAVATATLGFALYAVGERGPAVVAPIAGPLSDPS